MPDGADLRKIKGDIFPPQAYLRPLGIPGITAWLGANQILHPKPGETFVVSAAKGSVGTAAGQLLRRAGAPSIGIAGRAEKCVFAVKELGYERGLDLGAENFEALYDEALGAGIDRVFENVGGKPITLAMKHLKPFARIALCGLVASGNDGSYTPLPDLRPILTSRARFQGFIVTDGLEFWPQAQAEPKDLAGW